MLAVLLESRAARRRQNAGTAFGGTAFSLVAHLAILAVTIATSVGRALPRPESPKPVALTYVIPRPLRPTSAPRPIEPPLPRVLPAALTTTFTILRLPSPRFTSVPTIDFAQSARPSQTAIGPTSGLAGAVFRGIIDGGDDRPAGGAWRGSELAMRIVTSVTPRYPEMLRRAQVEGNVIIMFAIDTAGRVLMPSVKVVKSTHDLFTRAVMDALPGFRFKPAELGGHPVTALAEMPFEFTIGR